VTVTSRLVLALAVILPLTVLTAAPVRADGAGGGETISVTIPATAKVTCSTGGAQAGNGASLQRGDHLHCTATGFGPNERVNVTLHSTDQDVATVSASANGAVTYDFTVPDDLAFGQHTLTFTGATSRAVASYGFVVVNGQGGTSAGGGGSASGGGSAGGLASTGTDILGLLRGALLLIAAGALCYAAGRRRHQPPERL
jgi:hypothetical protein